MRALSLIGPLIALLSSSCCVIQLVLNFFSVSCAGFSILTPYRPFLTCLTVLVITFQLYHYRTLIPLVSLVLMLSPELVHWMNTQNNHFGQEYSILITGLGCEACANRIKRQLEAVDWIKQARVFFDNATALVMTDRPEEVVRLIESIDSRYGATIGGTN
ncbi:unnamed protein product [Rhizopus stolonifer]